MPTEMKQMTLTIGSETSLTKRADSKMQRALSDRLTPSEAIEAVGKMTAGYVQAGKISHSYIGLMVSIFNKYPRSVVLRGVEPDGIPRHTKFVPTPADVIGWLEEHTRPLQEQNEWDIRAERQIREREAWLNRSTPQEEIDRRKRIADDWTDRVDERARQLSGETPKGPLPLEEIDRLITEARLTAARINAGKMKLSEEARELIQQQDHVRDEDFAAIDR